MEAALPHPLIHTSSDSHCLPLGHGQSASASARQHQTLSSASPAVSLSLTTPTHHALFAACNLPLPRIRPRPLLVVRNSASAGYAAALAQIGQSRNSLEAISSDVQTLAQFLEDKQLFYFLTSPVVKEDHKKRVLKALADDAKFVPYTLNLLNLIVDKKRTGLLKEIIKEFGEIYNDMTDTHVAIVTSAVKIDSTQLALIAKKIQSLSGAKNVRMKNVLDSSVIAGFIVRFGKDGSRLIDMSVKGQLDHISQQIDLSQKVGAF